MNTWIAYSAPSRTGIESATGLLCHTNQLGLPGWIINITSTKSQ
jgi:hypothetical protein